VRHLRTPTGRAVAIAVAALSGAILTALLLPDRTPSDGFTAGRPAATGLPGEVLAAAQAEGNTTRQPPTTRRPDRPTAVPRLLTIPRLGLRMPVLARGVHHRGSMALPDRASRVGWYRFGSRPLDRSGATVLAGHVDTRAEGAGPLAGLAALRVGDVIEVRAGRRAVTYATTSVTRVSKALLDLPAVFSRAGPARLHLVTCGGAYLPEDGGYQDNVVVVARRLPSRS
jgi:sortase (surface protein transpeptidase)